MSAFDNAAAGAAATRRGRVAAAGSGGAFGAVAANPMAVATNSYQGGTFETMCEAVEQNLKRLSALNAALRKQVDVIGTRGDSADNRSRIASNVQRGRELIQQLSKAIQSDMPPHVDGPSSSSSSASAAAALASDVSSKERTARKTRHASYASAFMDTGKAFQALASDAADREKRNPLSAVLAASSSAAAAAEDARRGGAGAGARGGKGGRGGPSDEDEEAVMAQLQQVDLSASLIEERDQATDQIVSAVVEVNEIFRDLAVIVDSQGKDIEKIETNVTAAETATGKGVDELRQAAKYQKSYRNWILILAVVLILIAGGITAYFLIMNKKS